MRPQSPKSSREYDKNSLWTGLNPTSHPPRHGLNSSGMRNCCQMCANPCRLDRWKNFPAKWRQLQAARVRRERREQMTTTTTKTIIENFFSCADLSILLETK